MFHYQPTQSLKPRETEGLWMRACFLRSNMKVGELTTSEQIASNRAAKSIFLYLPFRSVCHILFYR